jgi:hypothetical protein
MLAGVWRIQKLFGLEVKARNRILINDLLNVLLVIYFMCMKDFHFEALGQRFKKTYKRFKSFSCTFDTAFLQHNNSKNVSHPMEFL